MKAIGLHPLHRFSALILAAFLVAHIGNHFTGLAGQEWHMAYMAAARRFYRIPLVETLLLILISWQAVSGLTLLWRARKNSRSSIAWMQQMSGLYLATFLMIHVGAVLFGRAALGLDTDFRFAAAGFHVGAFIWFFAPYYFLAVLSLFVHAGCGLYWNLPVWPELSRRRLLASFCFAGLIAGLLITLSLAGALYPVDIPDVYRATYSV